jgi:hypothetical protein
MDTQPVQSDSTNGMGSQQGSGESAPTLSVERIADAVYRLMLADTRLEQARAGTKRPRG